jgi:glutamate/tyrosine decarboxylase-like PLP-dependent enzyme
MINGDCEVKDVTSNPGPAEDTKRAGSGSGASGLPTKGAPWSDIEAQLRQLKNLDVDGLRGRLPAYIYYYNEELLEIQKRAFCAYILENGLGTETAFKSLGTMQSAIFDMAFRLFNAPKSAGAVFTSGGTISILDAVRMARNKARAERGERYGIFNIVAPFSAHPALNKAGDFLDVEIRRVPLGSNYRGDVKATADAIDDKTIMLFGSAPCYPFGVFDSIQEYSELALQRGLWLHVDACMGGFLSPFATKLGYKIPLWDFSLPGVTSISADIHKYGYGVKGASLLVFRDKELHKKHGEFVFHDWHRGTYASPSIAGSSPGGAISAAYAVMKFLGEEGYLRITKATMDAVAKWISGVNSIDGLRCFEPHGESALFGFYSTDPKVDILAVAERLKEKGWYPGLNTDPYAIQQGVTAVHIPIIDEYLAQLRDAVTAVRKTNAKGTFNARTY